MTLIRDQNHDADDIEEGVQMFRCSRRQLLENAARIIGCTVFADGGFGNMNEASAAPEAFYRCSKKLLGFDHLNRTLGQAYWEVLLLKFKENDQESFFLKAFENRVWESISTHDKYRELKQDILLLWYVGDLVNTPPHLRPLSFTSSFAWKALEISPPGVPYGLAFDRSGEMQQGSPGLHEKGS